MCGILGYISRHEIDENSFKKALLTLAKRGPDAVGIKRIKNGKNLNILFGHRRLAVLDLSSLANQPMTDESGRYTILFNGEIYNFLEIRKNLEKKGHVFRSNSDTEVLLRGYVEYGQKIVEKIEGMFAFAIYDHENKIITFARDHFGKKPFFYYLDGENLVFASELKAILKFPEIKKKLTVDSLSIVKFLFYGYIPSPNSIFGQVKKIEPSTTFQLDLKTWKIRNKYQYWKLEEVKINNSFSESIILEKLEKLIKDAVKKRLISDVPVGVFLSGGVDSSLITAIMASLSKNINSFTVSCPGYKNDETKYAEVVAKHLGIKTHIVPFEDNDVKKSFFEILDYLDEPIADPAIVPLYFIATRAKNKITVALSGDGGDEVFGGYSKYQAQLIIEKFGFFSFLTQVIKYFFPKQHIGRKLFEGFKMPLYARQFIFGSGGFLPREVTRLLSPNRLDINGVFSEARQYCAKFRHDDLLNKCLYLDCKIQLPDWYLVKSDRATMAASLELRSPLLDKKLVEFVFSLNGDWKIRNRQTKYLLKKLACRYVPKEVIYRNKKGFAVPLDEWMDKIINIKKFTISSPYLKSLFNEEYVKTLVSKEHVKDDGLKYKMFRLFVLNYYLEKNNL